MLVASTSALAAPNMRMLRRWANVRHQSTRLAFVHIPKTAGTAIENAAAEVGVKWGLVYELMLWNNASCTIQSVRKGACLAPSAATQLQSSGNGWSAGECEHHVRYECGQPSCRDCPSAAFAGRTPFEVGRVPSCSFRGVSAAAADQQTRSVYQQHCCYWWHLPPPLLRHDPRPALRTPHRFCVVRNPYTRLLSAYRDHWRRPVDCNSAYFASNLSGHEIATLRGQPTSIAAFNPPSLSAWVRLLDSGFSWADERTPRESWGRASNASMEESPSSSWSAHPLTCWFEPQSAYLAHEWRWARDLQDDTSGRVRRAHMAPSDRGCKIVLRYENLADEFAALMRWAGLNISLPVKRPTSSGTSAWKRAVCRPGLHLSREGRCFPREAPSPPSPPPVDTECLSPKGAQALLSDDALAIVHRRWRDDFSVLGYELGLNAG